MKFDFELKVFCPLERYAIIYGSLVKFAHFFIVLFFAFAVAFAWFCLKVMLTRAFFDF